MKQLIKNRTFWILSLIIVVATFLRLYKLGSLPISLFGDEVDVAYHAISLITTGRDYMGHFLPTYIQSLTEFRAPLLMYITAPFVGLFGSSPFVVRLPVALLGIASIYFLYLLAKKLFKSESVALLAAFFLAVTPWHIHYSRASFEVVPLIFLLLLGTYLFVKEKYFAGLVPFVLTFYTYSTANIFTPLLGIGFLAIYRPKLDLRRNWFRLILPLILVLPIVSNIFFGQAADRFKGISIFNDPKIIEGIILQRTDPWVAKSSLEVFFHNKYFAYATAFGQNYLKAFSPEFLFLQGDPNFRQSIGGQGELLWIVLPLLLYGFFVLFKNIKEKSSLLIAFWLLIAPIASSLTQDGGNHATRLFLMIPPLVIISSLGFSKLIKKTKSIYLILAVLSLFVFCLGNFWHRYSAHYRFESATMWQAGYSEIFTQLKPYLAGGHNIYINNTTAPTLTKFALFTNYPAAKFQSDFHGNNPDTFDNGLFKGFTFADNLYFGQAKDIESLQTLLQQGDIYLAAQGKEIPGDWDWSKTPPEGFESLAVTYDTLGKPQFYLIIKTSK